MTSVLSSLIHPARYVNVIDWVIVIVSNIIILLIVRYLMVCDVIVFWNGFIKIEMNANKYGASHWWPTNCVTLIEQAWILVCQTLDLNLAQPVVHLACVGANGWLICECLPGKHIKSRSHEGVHWCHETSAGRSSCEGGCFNIVKVRLFYRWSRYQVCNQLFQYCLSSNLRCLCPASCIVGGFDYN